MVKQRTAGNQISWCRTLTAERERSFSYVPTAEKQDLIPCPFASERMPAKILNTHTIEFSQIVATLFIHGLLMSRFFGWHVALN